MKSPRGSPKVSDTFADILSKRPKAVQELGSSLRVYESMAMDAWFEGVIDLYTLELCFQQDRYVKLIDDVGEWAFNMACMYEDCTYLSQEAFDKDAKAHLEKLIELVGRWIPPEIRDQQEGEP